VVVHIQNDPEDEEWRKASYEQFMKDDGPDDAVYDAYQCNSAKSSFAAFRSRRDS
jgi:hypothetical protein